MQVIWEQQKFHLFYLYAAYGAEEGFTYEELDKNPAFLYLHPSLVLLQVWMFVSEYGEKFVLKIGKHDLEQQKMRRVTEAGGVPEPILNPF